MRRVVVLLVVLGLLSACQSGTGNNTTVPTTGPTSSPTSTTGSTTGESTPTTVAADDALMERLGWLTGVFDAGTMSEAEYQANFTSDFIDNVSYQDFLSVVQQVSSPGAEWSVIDVESRQGDNATVLLGPSTDGERIRAQISIEPTVPHRIQGLLIQPAQPPTLDNPPKDYQSAADRLAEMGNLELLVADVTDGSCQAVFSSGPDDPAPVGSAIKLYVLGAVADAVEAGAITWEQKVAISDSLKSIPTGVMQNEDAGTEFSVREMAEAMIALSDNTATDHLIHLVGRDAVEQALSDWGMAQPSLDIPFMDTMDLTALKVGPASGLATQWVGADESARRDILAQISDITPADIPLSEFDHPIRPDEIEWFASPGDMCRVLVGLYDRGDPLTKILTINPGIPDDEGNFSVVAFKGGSEPGLVAMNWLVERKDGRRFVVAGSLVNPGESFDQLQATLLFGAVRDLVSGE
ncbi:MAG: serine hydrolase [Acidimicrobiia bacterium]